jgi:hypothetical protein
MITQNHTPLTSHTPQAQHSTAVNKYWCTFTYTGKETTFITKLFKHTNIRVAFRTNNNIWKHLSQTPPEHDKYKQSGVYKLTYPDCGKAYIGQTESSAPGLTNIKEPFTTTHNNQNSPYI